MLINRCFNVGNYIATIRGTSMNPGVPQCKNCWKWGHSTFSCRIQGSKCVKCNGPHKSEHHREFGWCCKANDKINPPRLATKKGEPCPHSFKCSNCKGDHQANSNSCPFWRHRFHREWHIKNMPRSVTTDQTPSALEQAAQTLNDYTKIEDFLTKCSKELNRH